MFYAPRMVAAVLLCQLSFPYATGIVADFKPESMPLSDLFGFLFEAYMAQCESLGMKSHLVVVKDFAGRYLVRMLCFTSGSKAFVTSKSAYEDIKNGSKDLFPIGFAMDRVFEFKGKEVAEPEITPSHLRPFCG